MTNKVLRYFEDDADFRTGSVKLGHGKCRCRQEVLVTEKIDIVHSVSIDKDARGGMKFSGEQKYEMQRTCDDSDKPILIFDNSDGEYHDIRICFDCLRVVMNQASKE